MIQAAEKQRKARVLSVAARERRHEKMELRLCGGYFDGEEGRKDRVLEIVGAEKGLCGGWFVCWCAVGEL